jgi:hypothetical protein
MYRRGMTRGKLWGKMAGHEGRFEMEKISGEDGGMKTAESVWQRRCDREIVEGVEKLGCLQDGLVWTWE